MWVSKRHEGRGKLWATFREILSSVGPCASFQKSNCGGRKFWAIFMKSEPVCVRVKESMVAEGFLGSFFLQIPSGLVWVSRAMVAGGNYRQFFLTF